MVSWKPVSYANGYEVYRSSSRSGKYVKVGETAGTIYIDAGLTTGKTYYYRVRAYCVDGSTITYGKFSSYKYSKPVPLAPSSISVACISPTSMQISGCTVDGATNYEIYRATSPRGYYRKVSVGSSISYLNTGLAKNRTYYYKVRVYTLVGRTKIYGSFSAVVR